MKTLTIDEALELISEVKPHHGDYETRQRQILTDLCRAQWEAAAELAGEYKLGRFHDEMNRLFPTTNPTQAGTMTDGPCGTCWDTEVIRADDDPLKGVEPTLIGKPCPDCKPSAPDTKGDPE